MTDADPARHFEKVNLDSVRTVRLKPGGEVPQFEWQQHVPQYQPRQAKQEGTR